MCHKNIGHSIQLKKKVWDYPTPPTHIWVNCPKYKTVFWTASLIASSTFKLTANYVCTKVAVLSDTMCQIYPVVYYTVQVTNQSFVQFK